MFFDHAYIRICTPMPSEVNSVTTTSMPRVAATEVEVICTQMGTVLPSATVVLEGIANETAGNDVYIIHNIWYCYVSYHHHQCELHE